MNKILVTGGAGYIGSHTVLILNELGYDVVVYDNLQSGHAEAVKPPAKMIHGDLKEESRLDEMFLQEQFSSIIHFAASIVAPESVEFPLTYYENNTMNTLRLLKAAEKHRVDKFIFSSSAAVYGMPETLPVTESSPLNPINPYGRSKLMDEWILEDMARAQPDFKYISLRYFNVAGADIQGRIGQSTPKTTHLIKMACRAALGMEEYLPIYGTDYPTPDGTGIRDYIHVTDLAEIHVRAMQHLEKEGCCEVFNCGYGSGYSVNEIVQAVQRISGGKIITRPTQRRPGDPAQLVADPSKLKKKMGWQPRYNDIETIVETAYKWEMHRTY